MDSRKTYFANLNIPDNKRTKIDMDYKEKYEEAYKLYHSEETTKDQKYVIERLFPELAESEDERIRKGLIEYFLHYPDHEITYYSLKSDSVISWLEKQGEQILANSARNCKDEQKPADKVEPKFKIGDWMVCGQYGSPCQIESIKDGRYYFTSGIGISVESVNIDYHLWSIQDAKDGDVLVSSSGKPFIFKGFFDNDPMAYGGLVADDSFWPASNSNWTTVYCKPATKEQRDLLFQKMHEAGYEWDADKKELSRLEEQLKQL